MIIAHRGIHDNKKIPENSILSFKEAINNNYPIEFDISITKDDKLIIFHDENLYRMTKLNKLVKDTNYNELKSLKLLDTNELIPTFKEVLNLVDGKVFLDIEVKHTNKTKKIVDLVIKELSNYKGNYSLKSFSPMIVKEFKKRNLNVKIGHLLTDEANNKLFNLYVKLKLFKFLKPDFLALDKKLIPKYYKKYKDKYPLYIYTTEGIKDSMNYSKKYRGIICISNNLEK